MSAKAAATRLNILQKAFALVYANGYRTTSIDQVIATTQVTKGAFFYHFKNKDDMGLAMINEVMRPGMEEALLTPLTSGKNPKEELYAMMHGLLLQNPFFVVKYGCPAINLIDELSGYSDAFNKTLTTLADNWRNAIIACIENGKSNGSIKPETNASQVALYVLASYGGIRNLGKMYGKDCYTPFLAEFKNYLSTL
ncbi:TetR family transcriptional regulator [Flavobacterium akiainvivens]|uniref:TetR family transcriptional regulator n=1 Tax=Flavobacterium akiainvivens TaxID=1202724 RepID=A0A0M8MD92_9FLAO|nr:TetR/AcrR family transcriptional regulator [Flavobacterium akiainvivens]KOS07765.1 TetR family transcriptional regulator [Flavobacterium akiainvivens]SFQ25868.1 transcriptional regulator, TetR family [Flavobacterium akiainvivens]